MGRRAKQTVEDIAEELCFVCKDGGDLRVCDFKNCLKAYHPRCVGKEDGSDDQFICDWHKCVNCQRNSYYQCLCCPSSSVCGDCLGKVEFVQVNESKGFCNNCLKMAISIEKNADADFDEARDDFRDTKTYVFLFKDYWEVIKDKEGLTLIDLQEASILLKRNLNSKQVRDPVKVPDEDHKEDEHLLGDNDDAEQTFLFDTKGNPNEVQASLKRKKSNKKTYVGWGSKELIEFLSCIGKDTTKPLDQFRVVAIVKEYIQQKNLFQDKKKKSVICDDKLHFLFRKRKLKYNMIYSLLEIHLAENAASDDENLDDSEDDDGSIVKKKPRNSLEPKIPKRYSERYKRCFAALNQNNLKLIYLKRSLVMNLLSHPETFEQKVVGCLVRVKNDRKSYSYQMSKKLYQLGLVTGIKKSSEEYKIKDTCTNILLCVSDMWDEVKISMLSEEDFEEDECNDIVLLVKKELFKRPTVAELEEKVASVHADIVNHWLDKELQRLEREIERANEKGWRQEMFDLMDQKKLLSTPAERQRRLEEVPEVTPDTEESKETESEAAAAAAAKKLMLGNRGSKTGRAACPKDLEENYKGATKQVADSVEVVIEESQEGATEQVADSFKVVVEQSPEGTTEQVADSLKFVIGGPSEGATEQVADSLNVVIEESPEGSIEQIADSLKVVTEESPGASEEQGVATCKVVSKDAGKALCNGGTPGPGLDNQMHNVQDGGTAQAISTDNEKDEDGSSHHNGGDIVVIDSDTDGDEDLNPEPERVARSAPEAMNGVAAPPRRASEAMNVVTAFTRHRHAPVAMNTDTEGIAMWHYLDPQGQARGPFSMNQMRHWKQNGFFSEDFIVWRTGQTVEQAILLTDAMGLTFQCPPFPPRLAW